jgi:MoaA/NifB/PqqE/SkfB family radical SAM enzyme
MTQQEEEKKLIIAIDVTARCNLNCPSCIRGNLPLHQFTNAHLDPDVYEKLLQRIHSQMEVNDFNKLAIWLYNWTEPLLHMRLNEIIAISKKYANYVAISSNFSFPSGKTKMIRKMLDAEPSAVKISVSGFTQDVHVVDHAKGNIEHVKENIAWAADYVKTSGVDIRKFEVGYHLYNYNLGEEATRMGEFCAEHGVEFRPYLAYLSPLENTFDSIEGKANAVVEEVQKRLLIAPPEVYEQMKSLPDFRKCNLRDGMVTLDVDLNVYLCCRTYNQILKTNIMENSLTEMFEEKQKSAFCKKCISYKQNQLWNPCIAVHMDKLTKEALAK